MLYWEYICVESCNHKFETANLYHRIPGKKDKSCLWSCTKHYNPLCINVLCQSYNCKTITESSAFIIDSSVIGLNTAITLSKIIQSNF